jgi:NADH-quinone oxidoreductase subunit F
MEDLDLTPLRNKLVEYIPKGRPALIPALHAAEQIYGYIPELAAAEISRALNTPLAEVYGVMDFFTMFHRQPTGETVVRVCTDPACAMAGAESIFEALSQRMAPKNGGTPAITLERSSCLGLCEHAPAMLVGEKQLGHVDASRINGRIEELGETPYGIIAGESRWLTINCGRRRATTLDEYVKGGGYSALKKALAMRPEQVIAEIKTSGLVGRGGAAFPTGAKWEGAARAAGEPKYVVCNGDEAEPGTFKDRVLMEEDPHRIIEGMIIAGYAVGAQKGFIFVRGEYPHAYQSMVEAIAEAARYGYVGQNVLGSGFTFEIETFRSAGAYVCGEETALFEAIEGKRGFPRAKPPFPTTNGLFNRPTVINNVETLCNVPLILSMGADEYRKIGTEKSTGTKLFCLSGDVAHPGLYEVPFGITLRHLIEDLAGGVRNGHSLQAILFGGAAGAFATAKDLDVRLSFEDLRAVGLPLGSGVITVFDETRDLRDVLLRLARFFADESCGKCYPCQLGTRRQYEIIQRLVDGRLIPGDVERLQDVGWTMTDASLCGLGQTAASAVLSAMRLWPQMFQIG